ncbi:MAG: DUF6056 family protein [Acidobacteriota bacterium]
MDESRRAPLVWLALVLPLWLVLVLCTHWEPVLGDGWGHLQFHHDNELTLKSVWFFAKYNYESMNPRIGQTLTMLLFTQGPWHAIVTPLVELALFFALTVLALGRAPSPRRLDDALVFATITAMTAVCAPVFGQMLFYRPYTGNYLYGLVVSLAFLIPYRLHVGTPRAWPWWSLVPMLVLGAAAGLSNEHTGPAFAAAAIAACVYRRDRLQPWMIAGIAGIVAGGLALYFAPGQSLRYNGLATQASLLGRIVDRGVLGNLRPFGIVLAYGSPALAWIALGLAARPAEPAPRARTAIAVALGAIALAIVATLLASPKLGLRLYLASSALACTAIASWLVPRLVARWARATAWAAAAGALVFVGYECVSTYHRAGREFAERMAALEHAAPNGKLVVPPLSVGKSRWFYGDDFALPSKRAAVAAQYGLASIELTQRVATPGPDEP